MQRTVCVGKWITCLGVLFASGQLLSAAVQVYDSRTDFSTGPSTPTNQWRYQMAGTSVNAGPYADIPYWDAEFSAWQLQAGNPPWLKIYREGGHPELLDDIVHTFLAPSKGLYFVFASIKSSTGGNGSVFQVSQGSAEGADTNIYSATVTSGESKAVFRKANVSSSVTADRSKDQLHFRVNCNGNLNSDAVIARYVLCKVGVEDVPEGYTTTLATAFGTGKPEASGSGFGQLGDKDPNGYPTWFYQMGMPGNSESFLLIPTWTADSIYQAEPSPQWGWCTVGASFVHPGPTESASTVVTYCSPYKPMKVSISCSANIDGSVDGVLLRIYKNDTLLEGCTLDLSSTGSGTFGANEVELLTGDCLYVTISPKGNQYSDSTALSVTITGVSAPKKGPIFSYH